MNTPDTSSDTSSGPLSGRVAVVTGGTGGIGTAIVARLARQGADVIAADLRKLLHPISSNLIANTIMFY